MERKNRIPITRLNRYYDEVDFNFDLDAADEVIKEDLNFIVVLYRVDGVHSQSDLYGESSAREVRYHPPVELHVIPKLDRAKNKTYGEKNGNLRYQEHGNLTLTLLNRELGDKDITVSYGDIIGYPVDEDTLRYFEVYDDGKINVDNKSTRFGYKSFYTIVQCVPLDPNVFNGI